MKPEEVDNARLMYAAAELNDVEDLGVETIDLTLPHNLLLQSFIQIVSSVSNGQVDHYNKLPDNDPNRMHFQNATDIFNEITADDELFDWVDNFSADAPPKKRGRGPAKKKEVPEKAPVSVRRRRRVEAPAKKTRKPREAKPVKKTRVKKEKASRKKAAAPKPKKTRTRTPKPVPRKKTSKQKGKKTRK
jgi:hypothetical protein